METIAHLDSHLVAWLFAAEHKRLKPFAKTIDSHTLVYSPMVEFELQYLYEIGRFTAPPARVLAELTARIGLRRSTADFARVVEASLA